MVQQAEDQGVSEDFIITMEDLRKNAMCASGVRRWFIDHGLDFKDFLVNGMLASKFVDTGDALGIRAVEMVRARRG